MYIKKTQLLVLFSILASLSGCAGSRTNMEISKQPLETIILTAAQNNQDKNNGGIFPSKIQTESGKVIFDATVVTGKNVDTQKLTVNTASYKTLNKDLVYSRLFQSVQTISNKVSETGKTNYYDGSKGESLTLSAGGISFLSDQAYPMLRAFRLSRQSDRYNVDKYDSDKNFDFCTRDQALKNITNELTQFGIDLGNTYDYNCYSLDYNTMKSQEYAIDQNGKEDKSLYKKDWDAGDDSYYFCIWQTCENLPVAWSQTDITGYDAPIQVIYSKRGIEFLTVQMTFDFSSGNKSIKLAPLDRIESCVTNKYNAIITNSKYTVKRMELINMAQLNRDNTYSTAPVWVLEISEKPEGSNNAYHFKMVIDAQTAKEIVQ